jgi:ribosomal-protein-alanine N-acetyltransferase
VHPRWRGQGYGEILLVGMVQRSLMMRASYVVLEVRVSNTRAQNLYLKHDFKTMLLKPRYYRNNDEDAYEMHLYLDTADKQARFAARYSRLCAEYHFTDRFSSP